MRRPDELARGLWEEVARVQEYADPLLYRKRLAYLQAQRLAVGGLETACVALVKALQRMEA